MKSKIPLLIFAFIQTAISIAQTGNIKGKVSTSDGSPATNVNVLIKEINRNTIANEKGEFIFNKINEGKYTIVASLIGLNNKTTIVEVKANQTTAIEDIILSENNRQLQEIIISSRKNYVKEPTIAITRLGIKDIENPQIIQVISQELIKDKQIQTVGEAIKSMAGINAFSASQYSDYVLRGFRGTDSNLAYNGIRGNFFQFDQAALTYNIETIEAIKGPASVLFSAGNPGGIINHVTKKAQTIPRYELNYTFGSFDQHRILADATGALSRDKKLSYRAIIGYENTGQLDPNLKIKNVFIAPQIQYNFSDKTSINFELNYADDFRTMGFNRGVPALYNSTTNTWTIDSFPQTSSLIDPNGRADRTSISNQLIFRHTFNDNVKLTSLFRSLSSDTFQGDLSPGNFSIGSENGQIPLENRYWNEDLYNFQASNFVNVKATQNKFIKNNFVVGFDFNVGGRTAEFAGFEERLVDVLNPEFGWGFYSQNDFDANIQDATYQSGWTEKTTFVAGYIQDQISIGEKFKLLLGGRFESHKFNIDNYDLATNEFTSNDKLSATKFLPRAGLVYNPNQNTAVYYSYSEGFLPQFGSNAGQGGPFPPERSRQHELGFKKEFLDKRLVTTVALYEIQKFDVLAQDPTDVDGLRLIQIDNVYSKGLEFSVQGKVTNNLDLIFNYAYNEARTPGDSGIDFFPAGWYPNAPNTNVNLWSKYTINNGLLKNLGLGAGFNYLGKRNTYITGFEIPEYTTVDAAINYKLKNYSISANIFNLTETTFYNGAYGPSNVWPGNPTSFRLSVGYVF